MSHVTIFPPLLGQIVTSLAEHQKSSWLKFRIHVSRQMYLNINLNIHSQCSDKLPLRSLWELNLAEGTVHSFLLSHAHSGTYVHVLE